ncbi:uncharacterized protein TRIREDRAFT_122168 [Trichoderma reesei QM6a]|uniref:Predicted protein n=2 Tax=Trichoderma TaxID=5543 RepID=G0RKY8_HYPJQ|nr:uncharacterized protein TRIREDRAFT_122168 [Trichoderma reesei QM6a]EGR47869.1 predicted protein [Trichoderma reesei QM6a]
MAGHVRQVLLLWRRLLRRAAGRRSVTYRYLPRRTAELGAVTTRINTGDGLGFLPASSSPPFSTAITSQRLHFLSTSTAFKMPSYIVTLKEDASDADLAAAKKKATDAGAKITQEYSLIKGFAVEYPEGTVVALDQDPNVQSVEKDHVVTTQ